MRRSVAAIALIRREEHGQTLWLARWNRKWGAFSFVGGHKQPEESFRACVVREIEEELALTYGSEFEVPERPSSHLEYTAWSESALEETEYTIELFDVELADSARHKVDAQPNNRWLAREEIRRGQALDGQSVSPTMELILERIRLERSS